MSEECIGSIGPVEVYRKIERDQTYLILKTGGRRRDFVSSVPDAGDSRNRPSHDHLVGEFFDFSGLEEVLREHRFDDTTLGITQTSLEYQTGYIITLKLSDQGIDDITVTDKKGRDMNDIIGFIPNYQTLVNIFTDYSMGDIPTLPRLRSALSKMGYRIN